MVPDMMGAWAVQDGPRPTASVPGRVAGEAGAGWQREAPPRQVSDWIKRPV